MSEQIKTKIPAEMEPAAVGGMVTDAKYIIDRVKNKNQTEINTEVGTEITNIKGGSSKSIANLDSEINGNGGIDERLETVEELAEISIGGGDIGIGTAADFESDDPEDLAKVPTIGAVLGSMDDEPTAGSENLIKSGGVELDNIKVKTFLPFNKQTRFEGWVAADNTISYGGFHKVVALNGASVLKIKRGADNFYIAIVKAYHNYADNEHITDFAIGETGVRYIDSSYTQTPLTIELPSDANYILIGESTNGISFRTPSLLMLDNYDVLKGIIVQTNNDIPDNSISSSKLENNAVNNDKIAAQAVSPEKTNFFITSKNLFDYTKAVIGKYINAAGEESSNESYSCSDYIAIDPSEENIVSNVFGYGGASNAFYNANKEFISYFKTATAQIPQNAAFVRWSFPSITTETGLKTIQVEYGIISTGFVPYGVIIKPDYFPQVEDKNKIIVPKYAYLLSGVNNDIFYEPILMKWNPYRYNVFANTTPNTRDYVKAIERVVTLNNPTATGISLSIYDSEVGDFIQTKSMTFRKGIQGVGASEIKVGIIGDSYVDGGCFTPALLTNGYVPNLKLVGTRQVTSYPTQCTDGRSGWALHTFFNVQTNVDFFNPFYHPQGSHRYWGNTAFWAGVCGGSPSDYQARYTQYASLCDSNGWPMNPIEGDVIYDSTYSVFKEYQSGSWVSVQQSDYTWEFNYSKYLSMWSIETPDILCVMLGVNDFWVNNYPTDANLLIWKERMNTIITSYKSSNPSGRFVILTANTVTHHNVLHYRPLDVHNRMQILRNFVINEWDNKESDGIYVVDTAQLIDSENAYALTEATPFDGFTGTVKEVYAYDGQHPRLNYTTLGYSLAAFIQYIR